MNQAILNSMSGTSMPSFTTSSAGPHSASTGSSSFGDTLKSAFDSANQLQNDAGAQATAFAAGQVSDIHTVMIASQKATIALELTTQVRNKVVEAYQEIMRISM